MWLQVDSALKPLLDAYFSPLSGVQVLAQPGNFYVASAFCLAISVIGKKMVNHHWNNLAQGDFFDSIFFFDPSQNAPFLDFWPGVFIQVRTMKIPSSCTTWMKVFMAHSAASSWEIPSQPHQCTRSVDHPDSAPFTRYWSIRSRFSFQYGNGSHIHRSRVRVGLVYV